MSRRLLWTLPLCLLIAGGCQQLIGLEERTLREADSGPPVSESCQAYCAAVIEGCAGGTDAFANIPDYGGSTPLCHATCMTWPEGDLTADEPTGNTVACRLKAAQLAKQLPSEQDKLLYCTAASPGGGGPGASKTCGSNCESYCALLSTVCGDPDADKCLSRCAALHDAEVMDADSDFPAFNDTVQCRLAHLSVAAFADAPAHCGHGQLIPAVDAQIGCGIKEDSPPSCKDYCPLINAACTGGLRVYESREQCEAVCSKVLPAGMAREQQGNSLACRRWRAYSALVDPTTHCSSAGPANPIGPADDQGNPLDCGNPCESYCMLLQEGCAAQFPFADLATCQAACAPRDQTFDGYTVAEGMAGGDTLECLLLHASRAVAGDPTACGGALGGAPCAPPGGAPAAE